MTGSDVSDGIVLYRRGQGGGAAKFAQMEPSRLPQFTARL